MQHQKLNLGLLNDEQIFLLLHCSFALKHSNARNCYLKDRQRERACTGKTEPVRFLCIVKCREMKKKNNTPIHAHDEISSGVTDQHWSAVLTMIQLSLSHRFCSLRKLHAFQKTNGSSYQSFCIFHITKLTPS